MFAPTFLRVHKLVRNLGCVNDERYGLSQALNSSLPCGLILCLSVTELEHPENIRAMPGFAKAKSLGKETSIKG